MALTEVAHQEKGSSNDGQQKHTEKKEKPLTKVIIRRLPPTMDQSLFLEQVSPVPDYDYIYSVKGDSALGENAFSRVYINFVNPEDVYNFKERFDNYVFLDNKGHEYPAVVEFASFQKIPKKRNKMKSDPKCGTIEADPVYLDFVESLKQQPQQEEKPEYSYQLTSENKTDTTTPLLEYVKQRRIERQRIKEERREERKRKEFERRKIRDDDRRKRYEERSPIKTVVIKPNTTKPATQSKEKDDEGKSKETENLDVAEKPQSEKSGYSSNIKNKERKNERTYPIKPKYPPKPEKKDYYEKKADFKSRREEYKPKYHEEYKKDDSKYVKKVKKYSERREERKNVKKVENEQDQTKNETENTSKDIGETKISRHEKTEQEKQQPEIPNKQPISEQQNETNSKINDNVGSGDRDESNECGKMKENDPRTQRRIRNKDRPTMAIYQPGMLSKRKQGDTDVDPKSNTSVSKEEN